ncbi:serine-rich repeat protein, putative [Schistosoma mansoni]|uniref:serine-rich repeat protein, putative n=1 Tax=Schistosoma mansoni TaxID=6183 RepID=UPI0001A61CBD|nr:serine-rich repeat protein, putative [Schistosoma mansoni]|eukprot:XP_018644357.1 serine-rich repeat protein, putative [Schistosoma mansoni]
MNIESEFSDNKLKYNEEILGVTREIKNIEIKEEVNDERTEERGLQKNSEGYEMTSKLKEHEKEMEEIAAEKLQTTKNKARKLDTIENKKRLKTKEAEYQVKNKQGIKDKRSKNKVNETEGKNDENNERTKTTKPAKINTQKRGSKKVGENQRNEKNLTTQKTKSENTSKNSKTEMNQTKDHLNEGTTKTLKKRKSGKNKNKIRVKHSIEQQDCVTVHQKRRGTTTERRNDVNDETSWDVETITVPMPSLTEDRLQTGSVSDAVQSVSPHEDTDSHGNNSLSSTDNKEGGENVSQSGRTSDVDFGGHSTDDDSRDVDERSSVDNDVTSVTKEGQSHETERGSVAVDMDGETVTQVVGEDKMVSVGEHEIVDNEQQGASRSPDVDRESRIEATPEPIDETSWDVETITVPMPSLTEDRLQTGSVSDAVQSVSPHEDTDSHGNNSLSSTDNKEGGENVSQSGRTSDVDFGGHSTDDDSRDVDERSSVDNDVTSVTKEGQSHETERGSVAVDMDGETVTQVVGEDKMVSVGEHEIVDNEQQGASRSPDVDRESRIEATPEPIDETSWDVETITVPMPSLTEDRLQTGSVSDAVHLVRNELNPPKAICLNFSTIIFPNSFCKLFQLNYLELEFMSFLSNGSIKYTIIGILRFTVIRKTETLSYPPDY